VSPELRATVATLYTEFPTTHDFESLRRTEYAPGTFDLLISSRRERLSPAELGFYAEKAMTTAGSVAVFKYFLPRVFELLAADLSAFGASAAQIAFGKLAYAEWWRWPEPQRDAVDGFFRAWWHDTRGRPSGEDPLAPIECVAAAVADAERLRPYLLAWRDDRRPEAVRSLSRCVTAVADIDLRKGRRTLRPLNWATPVQSEALHAFLLDPSTAESLERWWYANSGGPAADDVSHTISLLAMLRGL
jgi:hypothetical protein